jgi:hypothetical protein
MQLFLVDSKYTKWYFELIGKAQSRTLPKEVYTEKHHIIPKSLGGDNGKDNLVKLTAREHFIAHLFLYRCVASKQHKMKMGSAVHKMYQGKDGIRYKNTLFYESARKAVSEHIREVNTGSVAWNKGLTKEDPRVAKYSLPNANKGFSLGVIPWNTGIGNYFSGEELTKRSARAIGNKYALGNKITEEHRDKLSKVNTGDNNPSKRDDVRAKIKEKRLGTKRMCNIQLNASKFIKEECVQEYLSTGWVLGALPKGK